MEARKRQDAPDDLELVREFVNTRDLETDTEELVGSEDVARWLRERDLLDEPAQATRRRLEEAHEFREALRNLALANNGIPLQEPVIEVLEGVSRRADLQLRFGPDGTSSLEPRATGVDAGLGRLLTIVDRAMTKGTWARLKVCPSEGCLWAFYDRSKNRRGRWCQMAECGNRAKVRSYRQRQR